MRQEAWSEEEAANVEEQRPCIEEAEAELVLNAVTKYFGPAPNRQQALRLIAELIAKEIAPDDLIEAALSYVSRCRDTGVEFRGRVTPQTFYSFMYSRYLPGRNDDEQADY